MPLNGIDSNTAAEQYVNTKGNIFSNENILNVTDEFSSKRNGTANGEQTPYLPS